ncbi:MAG: 2-oxoacid:acceptor oxidoreductase subunit alpha [Anaerovoracaceae bacterium]
MDKEFISKESQGHKEPTKMVLQGNEACAKGAIHGGCRFFAGYPITPSTEVIEYLALEMGKAGGTFIQMEDEIASACAIVGARWGGRKAMTATSGPGFTLMQEAIGYAVSTETPVVIVDIQRGGPSTGQPTMSSQHDIYQARYGSHGDYQIIALAPSSVQEMYDFTKKAFQLAEEYRTPVILLGDEIVGHMREKISVDKEIEKEKEVIPVSAGSPCTDFYKGANTLVEGQLHDEMGRRIGHLPQKSGDFLVKLDEKISKNIDKIASIDTYFMEDAEIAIVAYGSVVRTSLNAVKLARGIKDDRITSKLKIVRDVITKGVPQTLQTDYGHLKVGLIKINTVWPFPEEQLKKLIKKVELIIVPEMNMGKYCREIERVAKKVKVISLAKSGGELPTPQEILNRIIKETGVKKEIEEDE